MKKTITLFTALFFNFGLLIFNCVGQAGSLDLTFSTDGIAADVLGYGRSVAVQTDGKIVVGGYVSTTNFVVARYNTNGVLDPTFDTDGEVSIPIPLGAIGANAEITIQSDGKIVVAGSADNSGNIDVAVFRLESNGALDNTFGTGGIVITTVGASFDFVTGIAMQADGKIVVVGSTNNGSNYDIFIIRYNSDGSLDTSFDTDGILINGLYTLLQDRASGVAIQADGKIVVAGTYNGNNVPVVIRYNSDGTFDTSFGSSGVYTNAGLNNTFVTDLAIQSDGKIVLSANASNDLYAMRLNSNGTIDNSFGTSGLANVSFTLSPETDVSTAVAIQSDGKIVLAGRAGSTNPNFALARFNTNGTIDNLFDSDGMVVTSLGGSSAIYDIAIQTDGKIVVAGDANISGNKIAVARYFGLCPFPSNPGTISGSTSTCTGSTQTYTISTVSGATSYTWTVPSGAVINSGQGTTSISVTFATTPGNITVTADNSCGSSSAQSLAVSLMTTLGMPGVISGNTSVCSGSINTYSISSVAGATGYTWTVPSGSTINSGQGTTSISVTAGATPGNITVTANNTCGSSTPRTLAITNAAPAQPGSISGSTSFCNGTMQTFTISAVSGATGYTWSVPADATINSGQGTTSISVTFGTTSGNVTVTSDNACGSSAPRTLAITVINAPATPGTISGNFAVCPSATGTYSISSVSGATGYVWSVPSDATINSGQGTTSINVTFGTSSGFVSVIASNSCGNSGMQFTAMSVMTPNAFFNWSATNLAVTFTNLSTETTTYSWAFGDAGTSAAPNPVHNYASSGTYTVELTATGTCGSDYYTTNITITDSTSGGDVSVSEIVNKPMLAVYPNPTTGKIRLINPENVSVSFSCSVEFYNVIGDLMHQESLVNTQTEYEFDLSNFPDGIYFMKYISGNGENTVKIIKH